MLDLADALAMVEARVRVLESEVVAAGSGALGRVLAQDVQADCDSPPFAKSLMDGYAVRAADAVPDAVLTIIEEVAAGQVPALAVGPGQATRLFTGAPVPSGADAVIMQEKVTVLGPTQIQITAAKTLPNQFIMPQGQEMRAGEIVMTPGTVLRPAGLGLLATVGCSLVSVVRRPRVMVLATGDELVEADETPGPGQIRNSNGPMLRAQAVAAGARVRYLGIANDDRESLFAAINAGLRRADVLIIAGGVSAGKRDLVPEVLTDCGVETHFHQIRVKPGKPLLFGTRGPSLVFGLPGNPLSSFVGFELFVKHALRALSGRPSAFVPPTVQLSLTEALRVDNNRPTYHPAVRVGERGVRALPWYGSPDLRAMVPADCLLVLPAGPHDYPAGAELTVHLLTTPTTLREDS